MKWVIPALAFGLIPGSGADPEAERDRANARSHAP